MVTDQVSGAKAPENFQDIILALHRFWADRGCVILQPYDMEVGAGTFHPATALRALGRRPWSAAYVQPSRRPADGRYGNNPNRLQHYYQYQVIRKPCPDEFREDYLKSLAVIGIDLANHDVRFVEDDWESQTLGAWGLGWEVWCDGMEVSQFTYFQQVAGRGCDPVAGEITYGLERLAMYVLGIENVFDLPYGTGGVTYGDLFRQTEREYSRWNFDVADIDALFAGFRAAEEECMRILNPPPFDPRIDPPFDPPIEYNTVMVHPAYDQCIKASHILNLLDARGVIGVAERVAYIERVRNLASACADAFLAAEATAV